jgi:osmotically-inducible protein OsmY
MKKNIIAILLSLFVALPVFGQQKEHKPSRKDVKLEEKAREELSKDQDFMQVKVFVEDQIATLRGTVDLLSQRIRAEEKVKKVRGIQRVRNEIALFPAALPDEVLYGRLQQRINSGDFEGVKLEVHQGRVIATGTLGSRRTAVKLADIIRSTEGVKEYEDRIQPVGN